MKSHSKLQIEVELHAAFQEKIDAWVSSALQEYRISFGDLLQALPGVFPSDALASIRRLDRAGKLPIGYRRAIEQSVGFRRPQVVTIPPSSYGNVYLEHPLDFEWFFTADAHAAIARKLCQVVDPHRGIVLCSGCPTFYAYGKAALPAYRFALLDKNAASLGQLSEAEMIGNVDLRYQVVPPLAAIAAVLDPPWYNDFYKLFVWAALENLGSGAHILLSFPPEGTRPSAAEDLADVTAWCRRAGAELIEQHRGALSYRSPLFEINALREQGIHNLPWTWRRGDLLVLKKRTIVSLPRPSVPEVTHQWRDFKIGPVRLKIRPEQETGGIPTLRKVGRTAVLPSVSTHYPGRGRANLVTSGNRFLDCSSPSTLMCICEDISLEDPVALDQKLIKPENRKVRGTLKKTMRILLAKETQEAINYLSEIDA
jgi:hypothetical protein